jgi:hypothetical protein
MWKALFAVFIVVALVVSDSFAAGRNGCSGGVCQTNQQQITQIDTLNLPPMPAPDAVSPGAESPSSSIAIASQYARPHAIGAGTCIRPVRKVLSAIHERKPVRSLVAGIAERKPVRKLAAAPLRLLLRRR